uniref:Splicing factor YJU2 n=2 Tax=Xenopus tropicalis TaxID=8364 RepID=A0A6I8PUC6_XENTR
MSERKVLNKYYPPDFDPSKIPKLKLPKDRQYVVRLMAPFNMRCKTCGEYIYKGKKFNARKETVQNELYLGLPIFRFYIKCTRCLAEITFKTDPENTDYAMEHGATRNFQAEKLIEEEEKRFQKEREEEELNNPMKVLENRTKDSKMEMEVLENLQELKELNQRQANVDFEAMLEVYKETEEEIRRRQEEEDEQEMRAMMEEANRKRMLVDSDSDEEGSEVKPKHTIKAKATDILVKNDHVQNKKQRGEKLEGGSLKVNSRQLLSGLVTRKQEVAQPDKSKQDNTKTDDEKIALKVTETQNYKLALPSKGTIPESYTKNVTSNLPGSSELFVMSAVCGFSQRLQPFWNSFKLRYRDYVLARLDLYSAIESYGRLPKSYIEGFKARKVFSPFTNVWIRKFCGFQNATTIFSYDRENNFCDIFTHQKSSWLLQIFSKRDFNHPKFVV